MHYYQFNIADYRKDTQHLSQIEHYIYRELMDWYYLDEKPIPKITQRVIRRLRLVSENNQDVINVLEEYFTDTAEGWVHGRIEREIDAYHRKADTAKANGAKGGRPKKPKKTQLVNLANPEITKGKANHKPLTINHKPIKEGKSSRFVPPCVKDVKTYCDERGNSIDPGSFVNFYETNGWMRGKTKIKDWKACVRTWESRNTLPASHDEQRLVL